MAPNALAQIAIDKVHGYPLQGYATYTAGGGGHTGQSGDSAMDLGTGGGTSLFVTDPGFLAALNAAAANDTLSVSLWIQLSAISQSSAFWFYAPDQGRAFQAHTPWSDDTVYFDTSGCCDGGSHVGSIMRRDGAGLGMVKERDEVEGVMNVQRGNSLN